MEELLFLLDNYFVVKSENKKMYYRIKDNYENFKKFIVDKLGYNLIIRNDFIKLEKLPGKAEEWMGIEEFTSKKEYIFFILILMFLEDKNREEQFILSSITDYVKNNSLDGNIDWTNYDNRRALIKSLKFAQNISLIIVNDGNEDEFRKDIDKEVLYENTGLSKYVVRHFSTDIMSVNNYKNLESFTIEGLNEDRGTIRKNRVYRRLLLAPVVYNEENYEEDYSYIRNYRNIIEEDFSKYLNWTLHVHKNGSLVVLGDENKIRDTFPNVKLALCDIVLHMNKEIVQNIDNYNYSAENDLINMELEKFKKIFINVREKNVSGWSKEYRDASIGYSFSKVLRYMKNFNFIKEKDGIITIYPLVGKVVGKYPEDYDGGENNEK